MIFNGLTPIFLLLAVINVVAAIDVGNALLKFKDDSIRGIYLYGTNTLGVALDKEVYVGQLQNDDLVEIARIPLDELVYADASGDSPLLEFKLINESSALTCTAGGCSVCSLSTDSTPKCYGIPLSHGKLKSVSAALVNNDIVLRTANDNGGASIHYFLPGDENYEDSGRQSKDAPSNSEFEAVYGFSTRTHSYFIGSAKRLDFPILPFKRQFTRNNTDIRITRICNNDLTSNLASRIDLVLSCEGITYKRIDKTVTNKVTAALYLPESSKLLVAFQHGENSADENYVCSYNFTDLQSKFTKTWDECQSIAKPEATKIECKSQYKAYVDYPEKCFLFSWDNPSQQPYCSAYNEASEPNDRFDNCELHTTTSTVRLYGSLENFKPYDGELLFVEDHTQPIVAIRESPNEGTLYALRKDNHVIRLLIGKENTTNVLTSIPGKPGKHLLEVLPNSNKVLFVPARSETTLSTFSSSCEGIYKTCESIAWKDPLHCLFCANEDGSGTIVPDKMSCPNNVIYHKVCPPTILAATKTDIGEYHITGSNLDKFLGDPEVTVCDSQCNLTSTVAPTIIRCSTGTPRSDACVVKIKGSLDSEYKNITLSKLLQRYPDYETTAIPTSDKPKSNSFIWKVVFFVIALVGLLASICIIYICISRHGATRLTPKPDIHLKPLPDQLNPNNLVVMYTQELGKGQSASVYKGSFKTSANRYEDVAVKIFNDRYAFMDAELIDELKVLRRVQHSNIVGFIGHTYIDRTLHIVTEYMAGGSLIQYIRDENNLLKYQHTFDYMDQILSAMVYLTEQQIVHRDLAARNCLLNHDYTVLKVSDFGLARSANFKGQYQVLHKETLLPIRWIAIEAFSHQNVTEKSDVWSFGVLVYELFTRGYEPYSPLDYHQIQDFLNSGQRLPCPETCPEPIYAVMLSCWDVEPAKRPTFKQLQKQIRDVVSFITNANKQLVDTEYERPRSQALTPNGSRSITVV
uniref:Protein kinase domain-containing protein n=1 Tax=Panagrellus redivivus TaxID=6233 RepID=A0A7E4VIB1_PANRE